MNGAMTTDAPGPKARSCGSDLSGCDHLLEYAWVGESLELVERVEVSRIGHTFEQVDGRKATRDDAMSMEPSEADEP